jgi:type IV pilus assembly protein PilM
MALKNKKIIGADIGAGTLQLVSANGRGKITRAVSYELPSGLVTQMQISSPEVLIKTIKSAKRAGKISGSSCILCLGGSDVIIRHILLPVMNDAQIYENVVSEISAYLPVNTENYSIDYSIEHDNPDRPSSQLKVMVVAIPKAPLKMYMECFKKAGLKVTAIDISENSQEKLIRHLMRSSGQPDYNFGVMDLGSETTNITTYLSGHFFVNKVAGIGGSILTADLSEALEVDILAAETLKRQENYFTSYSPAQKVVANYADQIIFEANRVLDYFRNRNSREAIEKVFICGGGSQLPGLTEYLQTNLDVEIESLNALMAPLFTRPPAASDNSVFAAAIGATFREV